MKPHDERMSYLLLFCMLLLAKRSKVPVEMTLAVVPLTGGAKRLASNLCSQ